MYRLRQLETGGGQLEAKPLRRSGSSCVTVWELPASIRFFARLFPRAFTGESRLYAFLFARFQIKGVALYFFDNVFLLDFAFEAAQSAGRGLAFRQVPGLAHAEPKNLNWRELWELERPERTEKLRSARAAETSGSARNANANGDRTE